MTPDYPEFPEAGQTWRDELPEVKSKWRHFKGSVYEVMGFAKDTTTKGHVVLYTKADGSENFLWARLLSEWQEKPEVKPTRAGKPDCLHPEEDHVAQCVPQSHGWEYYEHGEWLKAVILAGFGAGEDVMFCSACQEAAKLGRFVELPKDAA